MRREECIAAYVRLAETGMDGQEIAKAMGITYNALCHHLRRTGLLKSSFMPRSSFLDKYRKLVRDCPTMSNREMARSMGLSKAAFVRRLNRARAAGALEVYRIGWGSKPELAPPGMTRGYIPALAPRRRRKKDLGQAA